MKGVSVFLMAGGENTRWTLPTPKEIAPVHGVPCIRRTVEMLNRRDYAPIVITHKRVVMDALVGTASDIHSYRYPYIIEALWSLRLRWGKRNTVLFGDVAYTEGVLDEILSRREVPGWFASGPELLSMTWGNDRPCVHLILRTLAHAYGEDEAKIKGKCWNALWFRNRNNGHPDYLARRGIAEVTDPRCTDFDTPELYEKLMAIWADLGDGP